VRTANEERQQAQGQKSMRYRRAEHARRSAHRIE
jgi:hypothetical protein